MKANEQTLTTAGKTDSRGTGAAKYGILGAFAAVLCCIGPLIPILLGVGGAATLFGLDKYKPWFIGLGLLILALASWMAVRKQNRCCAVRSVKRNVQTVATVFGVGIGAYLLLQFAVLPVVASYASGKLAREDAAEIAPDTDLSSASLTVEGMTCAACAIGVEQALRDMPGVKSAKVNWRTGEASVTYDAARTTPEALLKAKVETQYTLKLHSN